MEKNSFDSAHKAKQLAQKQFGKSLCHTCSISPRYILNARNSVFILCPIKNPKYPPQPVLHCGEYRRELEGA